MPTSTTSISISWHIDDVKSIRPELTDAQCATVLERVKKTRDANIGVNWEVIEVVADICYPVRD